jgi:hypothetical protein
MTRCLFLVVLMMALPVFAVSEGTITPTVKWEPSFDAAMAKAKASGKPILLLHLFGRLDDELC